MEGSENVQAQTQAVAEVSGGISAAAEPQSVGVSAESTEPTGSTAEAPQETTEPVAEVQADASTTEEVVAEAAPEYPGIDSFDWESWDGSNYESFPEQVRPWADKLKSYHTDSLDSLASSHKTEVDYWKRMYEALSYGDEDPRISELTQSVEELTNREKQAQEQLAALNKEINTEREAENNRYFSWFEKNYQSKLEDLAKVNGVENAEKMVLDLMDLNMEVHVAVDLALMGGDAVDTAKALAEKINDSAIILELVNSRFPKNTETKGTIEKREVSPAAQVVAGSAPVSRPTELAKEKTPTYGTNNQRMASLVSAAENAIRKSKRR